MGAIQNGGVRPVLNAKGATMQFVVNVPNHFLDAMHRAPADFEREAKLAMAVKLFR
jgi:hypothetical protein